MFCVSKQYNFLGIYSQRGWQFVFSVSSHLLYLFSSLLYNLHNRAVPCQRFFVGVLAGDVDGGSKTIDLSRADSRLPCCLTSIQMTSCGTRERLGINVAS